MKYESVSEEFINPNIQKSMSSEVKLMIQDILVLLKLLSIL